MSARLLRARCAGLRGGIWRLDLLRERSQLGERELRASSHPTGQRRGGALRGMRGGAGELEQFAYLPYGRRLYAGRIGERGNPFITGHGPSCCCAG